MDHTILPTLDELRAWVAAQSPDWHAYLTYDSCPLARYLTATQGTPWGVEECQAWRLGAKRGHDEVPLTAPLSAFVYMIDLFDQEYYTNDDCSPQYGMVKRDEVLSIIAALPEVPHG